MQSAICLLSVVPMRKEPSHRSEMVSQILFGEYVSLIEEKEDFSLVRCLYDGYEGWVQANQLTQANENEIFTTAFYTNGFANLVTRNRTTVHIPFGSPVYGNGEMKFSVQGNDCQYLFQPQQTWNTTELKFTETSLEAVYQPFLNTPYLWGGKSVFGIDCSGFAQQVFKLFGVKLQRDAYLQVREGEGVSSLHGARPGDLAFFQNEKGRITHVGIVLRDNKIVHASGRVRIDTINSEGILNDETEKQTHVLHSIRRYF